MSLSPVVPLLGLGALLLFAREAGAKTSAPDAAPTPGGAGPLPPELDALTEIRLVAGQPVRFFRPAVVQALGGLLANRTLTALEATTLPGALAYYRLGPPPKAGAPSAQQQLTAHASAGQLVVAVPTIAAPAELPGQVVAAVPATFWLCAHQASGWAILYGSPAIQAEVPSAPGPQAPTIPVPPLPGVPSPSAPAPSAPAATPLDAHLPADVAAEVRAALADPEIEPAALEKMADTLQGYPLAQAALRARAQELRTKEALEHAKRGGSPFTLRSGDTASYLARYYTGDGNRWRELPGANPGMKVVTKAGVTQLDPWRVGQEILLPLSWKAWTKPLPPLQTSAATPATPAGKPASGPTSYRKK